MRRATTIACVFVDVGGVLLAGRIGKPAAQKHDHQTGFADISSMRSGIR